MPGKKKPAQKPEKAPNKRPIEQYDHKSKTRVNNPPVGLVTPKTDPLATTHKTYAYDPHLDPQLQWAGKKEHLSFEVPTVSLHVHERIDPRTIIEAVRKRNGNGRPIQGYLFETKEENPPLRDAIDFYRHPHGWSNRLIAGDSLLVMNSLLEKEGMAGQVQMVYLDPPYGIEYGSNFQPFVNNRTVKDRKDQDLTQEPETVKAFRDTWELGIHSFLSYLRDRLLLARELLHETGSCFVQIGDKNVHLIKDILDEVFGQKNFHALISFRKGFALAPKGLGGVTDYIVWYAKDLSKLKFHALFEEKPAGGDGRYGAVELPTGERRRLSREERDDPSLLLPGSKIFVPENLLAAGLTPSCVFPIEFDGLVFNPKSGRSWKTNQTGMLNLISKKRIVRFGDSLNYVLYHEDYPVAPLDNLWSDTGGATDVKYVVQTSTKVIQRCILMTTDPGDLI